MDEPICYDCEELLENCTCIDDYYWDEVLPCGCCACCGCSCYDAYDDDYDDDYDEEEEL